MNVQVLPYRFTICKLPDTEKLDLHKEFFFLGRTDEELSLVCKEEEVPDSVMDRSDDWRCFRLQGPLDFGLIGILSRLTTILAENRIGVFAVSTFDTDYILVKENNLEKALQVLALAGYRIRQD